MAGQNISPGNFTKDSVFYEGLIDAKNEGVTVPEGLYLIQPLFTKFVSAVSHTITFKSNGTTMLRWTHSVAGYVYWIELQMECTNCLKQLQFYVSSDGINPIIVNQNQTADSSQFGYLVIKV